MNWSHSSVRKFISRKDYIRTSEVAKLQRIEKYKISFECSRIMSNNNITI